MKTWQALLLGVVVLALLQTLLYYRQLPAQIATHFDVEGNADGFGNKVGFFGFALGLALVNAWFFAMALPWLLRKLPTELINMPNRDYWLAPARRAATLDRIQDTLGWFGALSGLALLVVLQATIQVNLEGGGRLSPWVGWTFGAYLAFALVWTVVVLRSFRLPAEAESTFAPR